MITHHSKLTLKSIIHLGILSIIFMILSYGITTNGNIQTVAAQDDGRTQIYFEPDHPTLSSDNLMKIIVDTKTTPVAFVHIDLTFDPSVIKLTGEIQTTPLLAKVVSISSMAEANASGRIVIALALSPDSPDQRNSPPNGFIEFAKIPIGLVNPGTKSYTSLTFTNNLIEVVDMVPMYVPFTAENLTIRLFTTSKLVTSAALPNIMILSRHSGLSTDSAVLPPLLSTSGGNLWLNFNTLPALSDVVTVVPRLASGLAYRFIIANGGSVFRTGDLGTSWGRYDFPINPTCNGHTGSDIVKFVVTDLHTSPADPSRIYLLLQCEYKTSTDLTSQGSTIYSSGDSGLSWNVISSPGEIINRIKPSPTVKGRVYKNSQGINSTYCGQASHWEQSNDAGSTWTANNFGCGEANSLLEVSPENSDLVYEIQPYTGTLFMERKGNDGSNLNRLNQPCTNLSDYSTRSITLLALTTHLNHLILSCPSNGVFRTLDGGSTWNPLAQNSGEQMVLDDGNPGRILWAKNDGLWASTDEGTTWQLLTADYSHSTEFLPMIRN